MTVHIRPPRRSVSALIAVTLGVGVLVVAVPAAYAGVGLGVSPTFPTSVTVGATGVPVSLQILNGSTPPESAGNVTLTAINLVPACGATSSIGSGDCPAAQADPGVFNLSPTAIGEVGTACAGANFTVTIVDPSTGQVTFTPSGPPIVLSPPATPNSVCRIDFTLDVLKAPTKPSEASGPGTVATAQLGFASGTSVVNGLSGNGAGSSQTIVALATPTISTTATSGTAVGSPVTDTATLSGAPSPAPAPTGTITFRLYGPGNPTCAGTAAFTSTVAVSSGAGNYTSTPFTPTTVGTYEWTAVYSGDANYLAANTPCGDAGESTVVSKQSPSIVTTASAPVGVGGSISDTATLNGGFAPTGTITFSVFGPNATTCTGTAAFTNTKTVTGSGTYHSDLFTPAAPGTYQFVAVYSGDANNNAVPSSCGDPSEAVTVGPASPTLVTTASASVPVGNPISDTATLSNGFNPTGTITFTVFGPNNATCTGTAAFTSTNTVTGPGNYASSSFTPTTAGTYRFIAAYSGDANNNPVTTACNDANETLVVTNVTPTLVTAASASVPLGNPISDTATLSNGFNPTGTITFTVFGPNNATCTGTAAFTSTNTVTGPGNYPSSSFTPTTAGTYQFTATYSGDANNNAVTTACNDANESVTVGKAPLSIATMVSATMIVPGGAFHDTATLSGQPAGAGVPTGTVTFNVYGPNDSTCSAVTFTSTNSLNGAGTSATSSSFSPANPGVYRIVAAYSGDANYNTAASNCNDPNETVQVGKASPTISTTPSGTAAAGTSFSDLATLSGGSSPSGSVTFTLYGPGDANCAGTPVATSTGTVSGGSAHSMLVPLTAAGVYDWIATYSGDAANNDIASSCGEAFTVQPGPLAHLSLSPASATITVGSAQPFTATGVDQYGNPISDVTSSTTFTINNGGTCSSNICTGPAGSYTVTGTDNGKTGTAALTVNPAATVTTLAASTTGTAFGTAVSYFAHVAASPPNPIPVTGTVSFYLNGSSTPLAVLPLNSSGNASFTTSGLGAGTNTMVAVYNGSVDFTTSTSTPVSVLIGGRVCTIDGGGHVGKVVVKSGQTVTICNASFKYEIVVQSGGILDVENSRVGPLTALGGQGDIRMCGSTVTGAVRVNKSTGFVVIGDSFDGCAPNTISDRLVIQNNTHGVQVIGNKVKGVIQASGNSGSGPFPEDTSATVAGNGP